MSLMGRPLVLLCGLLTLAAAAVTVVLWRRRWLAVRVVGLLLSEVLFVATAGLEFNRREEFYPSWQALTGDTGTHTQTAKPIARRLDASLDADAGKETVWQNPAAAAWHLAEPPRLVIPADYPQHPGARFPVVLALVPDARQALSAARQVRGALTVVLVPTRATTAAALHNLPDALDGDARVTSSGWDLVAAGPFAGLAEAFARSRPPGFVAARGWQVNQLAEPLNPAQLLPEGTA